MARAERLGNTWALSGYLDLTALGRQDAWEEPKDRAIPLEMHASGPGLRFPDEYKV